MTEKVVTLKKVGVDQPPTPPGLRRMTVYVAVSVDFKPDMHPDSVACAVRDYFDEMVQNELEVGQPGDEWSITAADTDSYETDVRE